MEEESKRKIAEEVKEANCELNSDAPWSDVDTKIHGPKSTPDCTEC